MSISPNIQTYSIENALKPFAKKVTELLVLTEHPRQGKFTELIPPSDSLRAAVKNLTDYGLEVCKLPEADEILRKEMAVACIQSSKSAAALTEEIKRISTLTTLTNCKGTYDAIEGVMEGTVKILVAWDDSEVRQIIRVAQISHDRLRLVQAAKSMRGLVVCYTGFTESMTAMLQLALERQEDMSNKIKREKLQKSLRTIQNNLQLLCDSTRKCIRNPSLAEDKDTIVEVISAAIMDLIEAVNKTSVTNMLEDGLINEDKVSSSSPLTSVTDTASTIDGSETLATNIDKAVSSAQKFRKSTEISATSPQSYRMSPQLDVYMQAIMKNSKAVADVSKPHYKEAIMKLREEIQELRHRLGVYFHQFQANPNSQQAKDKFNDTANLLCSKLLELDKLVAQSVADQVAETFVDTSGPIKEFLQAVVPPAYSSGDSSPTGSGDSDIEYRARSDELDRNIKVFRRRSLKLSETAVQATQGTLDRKRAKQVKIIAGELTDLTSSVVSTALKVKHDNVDHDQLHNIGRGWGHKAQELKVAVDEIIRPVDFTAATEANIADEMTKCRQAINEKNWVGLLSVAQSIAAKGRRLVEVGKVTVETISDPLQKTMITEALNDLEKNIATMIEQAEYVSTQPSNEQTESQFAKSLQKILTDIQRLQEILPDTSLSNTVHPQIKRAPQTITSTPISVPPPFTLDRNEWNSKTSLDESPILRSFNDRARATDTNTPPIRVDTSVGRYHNEGSQSVGVQVSNKQGVSIGTEMFPTSDKETPADQTPPSTLSGTYGVSPSDEWIYQSSTKETSPSSFAPTNASPYPSGREDQDLSDRTLPAMGIDNIVQYPSTLEGLNMTPSLYGMLNNQSDFSLTSDLDRQNQDKHDSQSLVARSMSTFTQPLQNVLTAASEGNMAELNTHASIFNTRTNRLMTLADTASNSVTDQNLASVLQEKSARLAHLTPQIIRHAKHKAQESKQEEGGMGQDGDLDVLVHQWTGHVRTLLDASQRANMPWSNTARRLVTSAKERSDLDTEINHISGHANRMVNVATTSIEAATTEDNIGSTNNLQHKTDPDVQKQIEYIRSQIHGMETITPDFISTAEQVATNTDEKDDDDDDDEQVTMATEQLNLLSHEWATKANALMKGVDDITIGMSGPADSLLISASSGDPALLDEQCRSIMELSKSMLKISQDSILGCTDEQMVDTVMRTAHALMEISQELVDCAKGLSGLTLGGDRGGEDRELLVETAEILRRDWSAKMHLLTAHIDDLTASVAGPLDRLVSVALQASRTEGMAKDYLLNQFEDKRMFTKTQVEAINSELKILVSSLSESNQTMQNCSMAVAFLTKVTPRAIEAARVLSRDPSSAKLDHFSHLRRQWASKAQNFRANLNTLEPDLDTSSLELTFHDLLQGHKSFRRRSVTPTPIGRKKYRQEEIDNEGEGHEITMDTIVRSYSNEDLEPPSGPAPPPPEMDNEQENLPYSKPMMYSEPPSPQQGHSSTTTPTKVTLRTPRSFTPDLSSKRHLSMGTLPSWGGDNNEDNPMNTSSASIAVAAKTLKDTADEFLEEGNPFIALAKKMSHQMYQMSQFARGRGELQTKSDMIHTAKAIAANAEQIARYANTVSEQCCDERMNTSLQSCSSMIPTLSTQLKIIASVKSCNPDDLSADIMLVKNAQNLMQAVIQTIQAAEAAYMKGLKPLDNSVEFDSVALAIEWKRKVYIQRTMETISAPMGAKGLRKLNKKNRYSTLSLTELLSPSRYK